MAFYHRKPAMALLPRLQLFSTTTYSQRSELLRTITQLHHRKLPVSKTGGKYLSTTPPLCFPSQKDPDKTSSHTPKPTTNISKPKPLSPNSRILTFLNRSTKADIAEKDHAYYAAMRARGWREDEIRDLKVIRFWVWRVIYWACFIGVCGGWFVWKWWVLGEVVG